MPTPNPIRMSSAGKCPRRQYYTAYETPESNPPDRQSYNRMALGDAAETILINNMIQDGWEITDTRAVEGGEQIEIVIDDPIPMTGHPDGICRHAEHTNGKWVPLECKSMSTPRLQEVIKDGIAQIYPDYMAQITCYSRVLYEQKQVTHPQRAIFAYMDRDGRNPPPERVSWTQAQETDIWNRLSNTWDMILKEQLPERPYEPDDKECEFCPYFTMCQLQDPPTTWDKPETILDPIIINAGQQWVEANIKRKQATGVIRKAVEDIYSSGIIAGPIQASLFWPRSRDEYDPELLEKEIPMEILRKCLNPDSKGPGFWIREKR